jgi:hypothetical protein
MKTQTKNLKTFLWLLTLMMTLSFFSCEKDPYEDCRKDPTCEYFTCKVNGERWEPQCDGGPLFGCTPWSVQYSKNIPSFDLSIKNEIKKQHILLIVHKTPLKLGENKLYIDEFIQTRYSDSFKSSECRRFKIDTLLPFSFKLNKIDSLNRILKGTFSFTAKNDCSEFVSITDGEFNLPYSF